MIRKISDTTLGLHTKKANEKIAIELLKYMYNTDSDLSWGYPEINKGRIIFITGLSEEERELPNFKLPILTEDLKGEEVVFVDIRQAVRIKDGVTYTSLDELVRDKSFFNVALTQAAFMLIIKEPSDIGPIYETLLKPLAGWITNTLSHNFMLDPTSKLELNAIVLDGIMSIIDNDKDEDIRDYLVSKMVIYGKLSSADVKEILKKTERKVHSFVDLIDNIKNSELSDRLSRLDPQSFSRVMMSTVFGIGLQERVMLSIEHIATWIAIYKAAADDKLYEKTQLASFIKRVSRAIGTKDFLYYVDAKMNEITQRISLEDGDSSAEPSDKDMNKVFVLSTDNHTLFIDKNEAIHRYRLYLGGFMDSDQSMQHLLEALANVQPNSVMEIIIHSRGGIVHQGMQLINIISNQFGDRVTTKLNSSGASMGAVMFCYGTKRVVNKYSETMFHTFSGGAIGKDQEIKSRIEHTDKMIPGFFEDIIVKRGMMSEQEFADMRIGKDFYFDTNDMIERGMATHILVNGKEVDVKEYKKES